MTSTVTAREADAACGSLDDAAGTVRHVPIASLHTSYARLHPGALPAPRCDQGVELPLRVAMAPDGGYQVLDGFKRLKRWREQGHALVPVVIEPVGAATEHKRLRRQCPTPDIDRDGRGTGGLLVSSR